MKATWGEPRAKMIFFFFLGGGGGGVGGWGVGGVGGVEGALIEQSRHSRPVKGLST